MKYYFEFLISILAVIIILYKPKELVTLHDTLLGKFIMVLVVIILSLKSCLGGVLGAVMFMSLESQNDIIEGACDSKNCKAKGIPLANGKGNMCNFMCTLQFKRYGSGKCKEECGDCCLENNPELREIEDELEGKEGFTGDDELSDNESDEDTEDEEDEEKELFNSGDSDEQVTMKFMDNSGIIDDSEFGSLVKHHETLGNGDDEEAKYNRYLNKKMKIHKFKDNYERKKKLYHKNKSIESEIKELEESNKLQMEKKKKLEKQIEDRDKEFLSAQLSSEIQKNTIKGTNPIPKEIKQKKLDDFLNSKFGKNNDLLSRVAAMNGQNTRHDNGNIKSGLSMDIDETSNSIDGLVSQAFGMFSKSGMPLAQAPVTDGGEDGLLNFAHSLHSMN